ncbi:RAI1 like PD-XK nuclease-domain-containing protein [Piptocephalis cylindrospora]|uniref:Decapping nuclease n=1 Tax=Piptocephalis cylindrospora TaxID=1907219 RepID=A0A4P9Y5A7_9FUNG|nr:RAI1 like PD-XK nuclease-domain-containing protein [Piptocephalis cylindrospora]|eukprot:RKP14123.1 RAI1 like PD-XK nuclease-domain-containing protein [Piptocephalis cylindrospora]
MSRALPRTFMVQPLSRFSGPLPGYTRPAEVASYSHDKHRQLHHDDRALAYYHAARVGETDLNTGYPDRYIKRDDGVDERLDGLCEAIQQAKQRKLQEHGTDERLLADVVCFRGVMTRLLCAPYDCSDGFSIRISKYKGTIYLCGETPEEKREAERMRGDRRYPMMDRMGYWGYRFEGYSTIPVPPDQLDRGQEEDTRVRKWKDDYVVDTHQEYCSVFASRLGQTRLLMGAEVDCGKNPGKGEDVMGRYVELKTSKLIKNDRDVRSFERYKLLKFWAQCFLPGIPRIVVGFRDEAGVVRKIQTIQTMEIPRMVRHQSHGWDASVCLKFLDELLMWLKTELSSLPEEVDMDGDIPVHSISMKAPFQSVELDLYTGRDGFLLRQYLDD